MTITSTLIAELSAAHPGLTFETVDKTQTARVDDDRYSDQLIGVVVDDFLIVDPFESTCGRFTADPVRDYGILESAANAILAHNCNGAKNSPLYP